MILLGFPYRVALTGPGPALIVFFLVYLLIISSFLFDLEFSLWVISAGQLVFGLTQKTIFSCFFVHPST